MIKAILYLILFAVIEITVGLLSGMVCSAEADKLFGTDFLAHIDRIDVMIAASGIIAVILIAAFLGTKWCPVSRNYVRTRPWGTIFWTMLLGLGIILPLTWLEELLPAEWTVNVQKEEMAGMLHSTAGYFVVAMLMPLAEEIVFRGAIIRALTTGFSKSSKINSSTETKGANGQTAKLSNDRTAKRLKISSYLAVVVSALFFAGAHMNPAQMPHAFLVGLILGWIFVRTGSIIPGFLVHWINNSAAYVMAALFPNVSVDDPLAAYFSYNHTAVLQAVLSSLCICLPAFYQIYQLTKKKH